RQAPYFNRGAGREVVATELHPRVDVLEIGIDIGGERLALHHVGPGRAGGRERDRDVREHLTDLRPHVALADDLGLAVAREDARYEHELAGHDGDDRSVEQMAFDHPLRQALREDVLSFDHRVLLWLYWWAANSMDASGEPGSLICGCLV